MNFSHRYILRKENFGGLLFDKLNAEIESVSEQQFKTLSKSDYIQVVDKGIVRMSSLCAPTRLFLVITKQCNLQCIHCSNNSGKTRKDELHLFDVKTIVDQFHEMGGFEIGINGGEPLCHPDFFKIVEYIRLKDIPIYLNTNGVYDGEVLFNLANSGICKIKISLDGMKDNHEKIRGQDTFTKTINTINYLTKNGNNVRLNLTLTKENKSDLLDVILLSDMLGCSLRIAPLISVGRARKLESIIVSTEEGRIIKSIAEEFCYRKKINISVEFDSNLVYSNCPDIIHQYNYLYTKCGNRRAHLSIDTSGFAYSTGRQTDFEENRPIGNIFSESLESIWDKNDKRNDSITDRCYICQSNDANILLQQAFQSKN